SGFRICVGLDRRRMDPRQRIYRVPLEPNWIHMVGWVPGRYWGAPERRLGRHLWIELCDGPRRLVTSPARGIFSGPDFCGPALGSGDRGGTFATHPRG